MQYIKRTIAIIIIFIIFVFQAPIISDDTSAKVAEGQEEWNIKSLNAEKSYEESKNLPRVKVAVLDSGLDSDVDIPFVERKDFLGESELHSIYQDSTGHGTSVAGMICARENKDRISGVAANVDLYVGRILDANNNAPVERVIKAVKWAMERKVKIIHMSFGTKKYSEELEEVIQEAYRQGILIIAAAGNDGNAAEDESTIEYPAAFDEVISVGATNSDNSVWESSSTGLELDVVAPGSQILSMGAFGGVIVDYGTSISAAQVTGIAAVLWGKYPDKSNEFIKHLLIESANADAVNGECGNGLVDYSQSVENYNQMNTIYENYKKKGISENAAIKLASRDLPENDNKVENYEEEVSYVNGLWGKNTHSGFVGEPGGIDELDIAIIKVASIVPDELMEMKTMSAHPCFHGDGNYFANVKYLLMYARQLINGQSEDLPEFSGVFLDPTNYDKLVKNTKYNIKSELEKCLKIFYEGCINELNGEKGIESFTMQQKGYAILGLALHTITDTFAHKGYRMDTSYSKEFCQIIHNRVDDTSAEWKGSVTQRWNELINSDRISQNDKEYYQYMLNNFACADNSEKMKIRCVLSQAVSTELIAALRSTDDFLDHMATILNDYKTVTTGDTEEIDKPENYRINGLNKNWNVVKDNSTFDISIDADESKKFILPNKSDVKVSIKSKNMTLSFKEINGYQYEVYYTNKNGKNVFFKKSGKKYVTEIKGMTGNKVYIIVFRNSHSRTKEIDIEYTITYCYKKKTKKQIVPFNPKKLSFKLYGNTFKLKKKKFKGWSKKKNAKKATYKAKKKMKFTGNVKLKLYCVKK